MEQEDVHKRKTNQAIICIPGLNRFFTRVSWNQTGNKSTIVDRDKGIATRFKVFKIRNNHNKNNLQYSLLRSNYYKYTYQIYKIIDYFLPESSFKT